MAAWLRPIPEVRRVASFWNVIVATVSWQDSGRIFRSYRSGNIDRCPIDIHVPAVRFNEKCLHWDWISNRDLKVNNPFTIPLSCRSTEFTEDIEQSACHGAPGGRSAINLARRKVAMPALPDGHQARKLQSCCH
ncbi:hypothetical protein ACFFWD_11590 [Bradyrhizobium erythrophlei]|uniref:hypothetical protein n=1 Tax=Bradyrhizobium erythrophlei TaxID=1437360 RepID=UPI0035E9D5B8